ncbi:MAG: DUF1800 domain-containing protein [Acidobacteriota bacterium]
MSHIASSLPKMRRQPPRPSVARTSGGAQKNAETVPLAVLVYNRLGFGLRPGDVAAFEALGPNDDARLTAWIDQQINPDSLADGELVAAINAAGFVTLNKSRTQLWIDHVVGNVERTRPREETERVSFLRAQYSRRQLREVMSDFWHNHFNVDAGDFWAAPMFVHYDRDVIREHAFGNFRDLLGAVAQSTAMLYYLDNYTSSNAGPNENFCRELFELHTLGAENYLGIQQQNQVPVDGDGKPIGYVDADVFEATRAFTGWSVANSNSVGNTGEFLYRDEWHDRFQKSVLGVFMPADRPPLADGNQVLDVLAEHPGTARHVCGKLCRRLTVDDPPQALVDTAVAAWTTHIAAPDQIAQVVRAIVLAPEFRQGWGEKSKRPFEVAAAALRTCESTMNFAFDDGDSNSFLNRFNDCGQELFRWPAPNGYPDVRGAWQSNSPRALTWRLMQWLVDHDDSNGDLLLDVVGQTPNGVRSANAIVDFWIDRALGRAIPEATRQELVDFMGQGFNPDMDLPVDSDNDTADRVRSLVGLIMMTPYFLWK